MNETIETIESDTSEEIHSIIDTIITGIENIEPNTKSSKQVNFKNVDLYMFERTQGFECIPSDTSKVTVTLGMAKNHTIKTSFETLSDYLTAKRNEHLDVLEAEKVKIVHRRKEIGKIINGNNFFKSKQANALTADLLMSDYTDEEANKIVNTVLNRDKYEDIDVDLPVCTDIFCPILGADERYTKLVEEGLSESEIDKGENDEITEIQESREETGCKCGTRGISCEENENCSCWSNGIGCQVDKPGYPCNCSARKCKNSFGLKRFNYETVLAHYQNILRKPAVEPKKPTTKRKRRGKNYTSHKKRKRK